MSNSEIIALVVAFAAMGFSLYRKYVRKNQGDKTGLPGTGKPSSFTSSKDDDYEPYSGK